MCKKKVLRTSVLLFVHKRYHFNNYHVRLSGRKTHTRPSALQCIVECRSDVEHHICCSRKRILTVSFVHLRHSTQWRKPSWFLVFFLSFQIQVKVLNFPRDHPKAFCTYQNIFAACKVAQITKLSTPQFVMHYLRHCTHFWHKQLCNAIASPCDVTLYEVMMT